MTSTQYASGLQQLAAFLAALTAFDVGTATPQVLFSFTDAPSFSAAVKSLGDGQFTFRDSQMVEFVSGSEPITLRLTGVPLTMAQKSGAVTMSASAASTSAVPIAASSAKS